MIECTTQLTPRYIWELTNYSLKLSRPLVIWRRICIIVSPLLAADALYQILIEIKAFWIFELVISLAILVYSIWGIKIVLYIKSYRIYKKKGACYITVHFCFTEDKIIFTVKDKTDTLEWDKIDAFSSDSEYYFFSINRKTDSLAIAKSGFNKNDLEQFERLIQQKIARQK